MYELVLVRSTVGQRVLELLLHLGGVGDVQIDKARCYGNQFSSVRKGESLTRVRTVDVDVFLAALCCHSVSVQWCQ